MDRYFIIHKPYKMVSQFVSPHKKQLLGDLDFKFPEGTHAVGRLDENSEGLLILTTDKSLTERLLNPAHCHQRTYVVQVEKTVSAETLRQLSEGILIRTPREGDYTTRPCTVNLIEKPEWLGLRSHEFRSDLPQSWLELILTEGKYHQVRKMCAAVKHDCKRLIRTAINDLELEGLPSGGVREMNKEELFQKLNLGH